MNKEWKQQANIAAAKVLGYYGEGVEPKCDGTVAIFIDENGVLTWEPVRYLTIFGATIDAKVARDDVVQALGEKHQIAIVPYHFRDLAGTRWKAWAAIDTSIGRYIQSSEGFQGNELATEKKAEAIGHACIAVVGGE